MNYDKYLWQRDFVSCFFLLVHIRTFIKKQKKNFWFCWEKNCPNSRIAEKVIEAWKMKTKAKTIENIFTHTHMCYVVMFSLWIMANDRCVWNKLIEIMHMTWNFLFFSCDSKAHWARRYRPFHTVRMKDRLSSSFKIKIQCEQKNHFNGETKTNFTWRICVTSVSSMNTYHEYKRLLMDFVVVVWHVCICDAFKW